MKEIIQPFRAIILSSQSRAALKSQPELKALRKKLLLMGGDSVVLMFEPDLRDILTRGVLFDNYPIKLREMRSSRCHSNVATLWDKNKSVKIVTGWALSDDGLWRQHSWALRNKTIIETTETRLKYFGYTLTDAEAEQFWWDNW